MTVYRDDTETLRAKVEALDAANARLESERQRLLRTIRYNQPSMWTVAGTLAAGAAAGILMLLAGPAWMSRPRDPVLAPTALVIHNAWCYRAYDVSDSASAGGVLSWTTMEGTRMRASWENVTVVYPRDTTPSGWDAAYQDALLTAADCE